MDSPSLTTVQGLQLKHLDDCDNLVNAIVQRGDISQILFKENVLSDYSMKLYASVDKNTELELQLKFLLRLVSMEVIDDESKWERFLNTIFKLGMQNVSIALRQNVSSIAEVHLVCNKYERVDTFLVKEHIPLLLEVLNPIAHKWNLLKVALSIKENINFIEDHKICLCKILTLWINQCRQISTLSRLEEALKSETLVEGPLSIELMERFSSATTELTYGELEDSTHFSVNIANNSETRVNEGSTTLLLINSTHKKNVSYQWKKDNQSLVNSFFYSGVNDDFLVIKHANINIQGAYSCCVKYQDKEFCSNKTDVIISLPLGKTRLLTLYSNRGINYYHPLLRGATSKKFINIHTKYSSTSSSDNAYYSSVWDESNHEFSKYRSGKLVLIYGLPGSGKSTLVCKIVEDWAKGCTLINSKLVFLICVANGNSAAENLFTLLKSIYYDDDETKKIIQLIEEENGEGVCFIIDGFEQCEQKSESVLYQIIEKEYLTDSMVIVSCRPSGLMKLKINTCATIIEMVGFGDHQIYDYIDSVKFPSKEKRDNLKKCLQLYPNILNVCNLPLNLAIISFMFQREKSLCTETEVFKEFIETKKSLKNQMGDTKNSLASLCKIAYGMILDSELSSQVWAEDVSSDEDFFDLLTVNHTGCLYEFCHNTIRDYLAANYIASLKNEDEIAIIGNPALKKFPQVLCFYFGITDFTSSECELDELINKLLENEYDTLQLLKFAFESQQPYVCDIVVESLEFILDFNTVLITSSKENLDDNCCIYSSADLLAVNYTLFNTSPTVKKICLPQGITTQLFLETIYHENLSQLQELVIDSLDNFGVQLLANSIQFYKNLTTIDLTFNQALCEDAKILLNRLLYLSCLKTLTIKCISILSGITELRSGLVFLTNIDINLKFTHLDSNCISEVAQELLLNLNNIDLQTLEISNSEITPKEAKELSSGLQKLSKLRSLNVSKNKICCQGATTLASAIKLLTNLEILDLSCNCIGPEGMKSLVGAFKHMSSLSYLNLSSNNIGSCGLYYLADVLHYLNNMNEVQISNENCDQNAIDYLLRVARKCRNLQIVINGFAAQHSAEKEAFRFENCHISVTLWKQTKLKIKICSFLIILLSFICYFILLFLNLL